MYDFPVPIHCLTMPLFLGGFRFRLNFYDASYYIQAHKYFHYMVSLPQIVRRILYTTCRCIYCSLLAIKWIKLNRVKWLSIEYTRWQTKPLRESFGYHECRAWKVSSAFGNLAAVLHSVFITDWPSDLKQYFSADVIYET